MTARTRTRTKPKPAKKTAANKPPAKTTTGPVLTLVDLRHPLTVRRRNFVGPYTQHQIAGARAALASAALQLPIPINAWNGPTATLADGTLITHNDRTGQTPTHVPPPDFTVQTACPHGAIHTDSIRNARDLAAARAITRACGNDHTNATTDSDGTQLNWDKAISRGVGPITRPKPSVVLQLTEGVRRANATKADTQELRLDDIADGLAVRAEDDTAKEHPDHA